jgi:hypothetical protein
MSDVHVMAREQIKNVTKGVKPDFGEPHDLAFDAKPPSKSPI